jgi:glutathione S-transferase
MPTLVAVQKNPWVRAYYERLDGELARQPFVAGERFTVADITALVIVDFATNLVELKPDDGLSDLWRWHAEMSARPSATA